MLMNLLKPKTSNYRTDPYADRLSEAATFDVTLFTQENRLGKDSWKQWFMC